MSESNSTLNPKLTALAEQLLDSSLASEDDAFKLDAFKVLSGFYISRAKLGKMAPEEEGAFGAMRDSIKKAGGK
jgi:hypothetical protein